MSVKVEASATDPDGNYYKCPLHFKPSGSFIEEFKENLRKLKKDPVDYQTSRFHDWCRHQEHQKRFLSLGSRDEVEYGLYMGIREAGSRKLEDEEQDRYQVGLLGFDTGNFRGRKVLSNDVNCLHYVNEQDPAGEIYVDGPDIVSKEPSVRRFLEIGRLVTYSEQHEPRWWETRFCVVLSFDDKRLWIVSRPKFHVDNSGDEDGEDGPLEHTQPKDRAFPLDGFEQKIACARLKANVESLREYEYSSLGPDQEWRLHRPEPSPSRLFEIEKVHSGGFVIGRTPLVTYTKNHRFRTLTYD